MTAYTKRLSARRGVTLNRKKQEENIKYLDEWFKKCQTALTEEIQIREELGISSVTFDDEWRVFIDGRDAEAETRDIDTLDGLMRYREEHPPRFNTLDLADPDKREDTIRLIKELWREEHG